MPSHHRRRQPYPCRRHLLLYRSSLTHPRRYNLHHYNPSPTPTTCPSSRTRRPQRRCNPPHQVSVVVFSNFVVGLWHYHGGRPRLLVGLFVADDHFFFAGQRRWGHGGPTTSGTLYGGVDGLLFQGRNSLLPHVSAAAIAWSPYHAHTRDAGMEATAYGGANARPPTFL
jgi:hypothetical protein